MCWTQPTFNLHQDLDNAFKNFLSNATSLTKQILRNFQSPHN